MLDNIQPRKDTTRNYPKKVFHFFGSKLANIPLQDGKLRKNFGKLRKKDNKIAILSLSSPYSWLFKKKYDDEELRSSDFFSYVFPELSRRQSGHTQESIVKTFAIVITHSKSQVFNVAILVIGE